MTFGYFSSQKSNAPAAAVQIMITKRLAPPLGEQKLCHVHLPEGKTRSREPIQFYFCGRSRTAMVSMWSVWGNMSTGWRRVTR